ncbi:MAG: hypothetical protein JW717_12580 [Marinilabiliaceae bacterium]|nr:hypothetical protein [Marinilabiliaceae bacterium]
MTSDSLWELTLDGIHPVLVIKSDQTTISHVYVLSNYPNTTFRSVNVEKTIGLGEIIFRPNTLNHLHLDRGNKIFTNVLQFLPRSDVNSPVTTLNLKYNNNGTATVFPSNIIYGNIIVESEVNYENEKDLDNVVLQLGDKGVFSDIFAWHYTGANHLTYTSYSTGTSTVPQYVTHQIGVLGTIRNNPNEGIFPRDGAGLDIFKYHFNSKETIAGSTNPYNERR